MAPAEAPARTPRLGRRGVRLLSVPPQPPSQALRGVEPQGLSPARDCCAGGSLSELPGGVAGAGAWGSPVGRGRRRSPHLGRFSAPPFSWPPPRNHLSSGPVPQMDRQSLFVRPTVFLKFAHLEAAHFGPLYLPRNC